MPRPAFRRLVRLAFGAGMLVFAAAGPAPGAPGLPDVLRRGGGATPALPLAAVGAFVQADSAEWRSAPAVYKVPQAMPAEAGM